MATSECVQILASYGLEELVATAACAEILEESDDWGNNPTLRALGEDSDDESGFAKFDDKQVGRARARARAVARGTRYSGTAADRSPDDSCLRVR